MLPESATLNGGGKITGDLLVPGTPLVRLNGNPNYKGTLDGKGNASPSDFQITLNGNATLGHVVRRTDSVLLPTVNAPPQPTATDSVVITTIGQYVNWTAVRNLTLNGGVGQYTVPAGVYGDFTVNGGSGLTLGIAGATQAAIYNFQHLTLNGQSEIRIVGPVVLNVANGFSVNSLVGSPSNPSWLALNVASGNLTLNSSASLYAYLVAPSSSLTIGGNGQLVGGIVADRLTVNGSGLARLMAPAKSNQPPAIFLTSPANGSSYTAPASFALTASAADSDGSVSKVEFFRGTTKLGEDTIAPYEFSVTGLGAGSYTFSARATDNLGTSTDATPITVTVTNPNQPPSVVLTSPSDGALLIAPATVTLAATATDPDGTIARVEFYQDDAKIGEDTTSPYEYSVSGFTAGTYTFSARAYDNQAAPTSSTAVTVTVVNPNLPPVVSLTSPASGSSFTAPAGFALVASAADPDGSITKVEFYQDGSYIGAATAAPYQWSVAGLAPGAYNFVARAYDNQQSATDSLAIAVAVAAPNQLPTVTLDAPANGAILAAFTNVVLSATAIDPDGTIARVEFYQGAAKIGEGSATGGSTYRYNITAGLAPGTYSFKARAYDNANAFTDSAMINVTVLVGLPFSADFEANEGYYLGPLAGQLGWQILAGTASIVEDAAFSGTRSVVLAPSAPPAQVTQSFAPLAGESIIFFDLFAKPVAEADVSASSTFNVESARFAFVRNGAQAELRAFNGDGAGGGTWSTTRFTAPIGPDGAVTNWIRLTVRMDFAAKRWDLYANGTLVGIDLHFQDNSRSTLSTFFVRGDASVATRIDYLFAAAVNPLFVDADKDGMDDAWEAANGLNPTTNDRNGDKDGDGVTNIQEFIYGTRADLSDTDGDGLSDAWEIAHGTNPLVSDASKDSDGDGISDAQEYLNGTDPLDYYNGVAPALTYGGPGLQVSRSGLIGPWPLGVSVANASTGAVLRNAPVTFTLGDADGRFAVSATESAGAAQLIVRTDANGVARAWFKLTTGLSSRVSAAARVYIGSATVRELAFQITPLIESLELAAGLDQSLWVDDAGVARAWGRNIAGQLGDGTFVARSQMQRLAAITAPLKSAAYGASHGLAVTSMGQVYAWGDDYFGQLGDGRTTLRRTPAPLSMPSGVVQVAAGDAHSLALCADGTVWAWGCNQSGQLGDGTYTDRSTPQQIVGLSNIVRIVAGARHSAALAADGTVWTWGANEFGQLAVTGITDRAQPGSVGGLNGVVSLISGRQHLLALRDDGTVLAWGDNHAGQLGIGTNRSVITPQILSQLPTSVGLSAGSGHSVALGADGVLRGWGANGSGQLGTGNTTASAVPLALSVTNIRAFTAGADHVVVLRTDGTLQAWGLNTYGQLGVAPGAPATSPVQVSPPVD